MKLKFKIKKLYGRLIHYPDCEASRAIIASSGRISFRKREIEFLKQGGFEIELDQDPSALKPHTIPNRVGAKTTARRHWSEGDIASWFPASYKNFDPRC